jgi:hypothetical protein
MEIILINVLLWVFTIIGYIIYNLYTKNTKLEQMVIEREQTLQVLGDVINESDRVLNELDRIGAFKSDDEIGYFFNTVKTIQSTLNEFAVNNK